MVICEMYMLRNGNLGLKMGISRAARTQYAYIMEVLPSPVPTLAPAPTTISSTCITVFIFNSHALTFNTANNEFGHEAIISL